ncbi:MAG TPA: hypothetical protein VNP89_09435 [Gaiellaceae bacterium]|nr:hypothetical protein [Gaiellaceae bacterium]
MSDELTYLQEEYRRLPPADQTVERVARARLAAVIAPRRRRRRPSVLLAAALLVGLTALAAPAVAGRGPLTHVIEFLRGDPPDELVTDLERLDRGAPAGMEQEPIVAKTGKVYEARTNLGVVRIWLTPTKTGRVCGTFEAPDEKGRTRPFTSGCMPALPNRPITVSTSLNYDVGYVQGRVSGAIERLELEYANAHRENLPLQNGFFVAPIPPERVPRGTDQPARLIGRGEDGDIVHVEDLRGFLGERFPHQGSERPPVAEVAREREVVGVPVNGSRAILYESPSRIGGTCARLAVGAETWSWDCAKDDEPRLPVRFVLHRASAGGQPAVVIAGIARTGVAVELVYEDGLRERPTLHGRRFLIVLPEQRWVDGRRLQEIVGIGADGQQAIRYPMATTGARFYSGPPDQMSRPAMQQKVWRPEWPLVARVGLETERAGEISLEVRRLNDRQWAETLRQDGTPFGGGELRWFPEDKPDATISIGWLPILSDDGKRDAFVYSGQIRVGTGLRAVYRDGASESIEIVKPSATVGPNLGFFLFEVTDERREKRFARFEALDDAGNVVASVPAPPVG